VRTYPPESEALLEILAVNLAEARRALDRDAQSSLAHRPKRNGGFWRPKNDSRRSAQWDQDLKLTDCVEEVGD
jgi:hypothetical protein